MEAIDVINYTLVELDKIDNVFLIAVGESRVNLGRLRTVFEKMCSHAVNILADSRYVDYTKMAQRLNDERSKVEEENKTRDLEQVRVRLGEINVPTN
jgi:hypothetical protein